MRFPIAAALLAATALPAHAQVAKPAAITADGVPAIPVTLAEQVRPYLEARSASAVAWNPVDRSLLISTRFANVAQLHSVRQPLADRRQITFEADRIGGARYSKTGDVLVVSKDVGGGEFFQLYTLKDGRLTLITDGKSRNQFGAFSKDGKLVGYSSTRRNGTDSDLYVVDPRNPKTDRLVAQVKGGGWGIADFAPDGKRAVVAQYLSVQKSVLYYLDLASGKMTPITDPAADVAYGDAHFAPDGTLWVLSDEGSDVQRLGTLDPKTRKFTAVTPAAKWDVDEFAIAEDGGFIAYVVNEDGVGRLKLLDPKNGQSRDVTGLPVGVAGGLEIAPWGAIGLSVSSATVPGDAYSVDPATLAVTRWTESETGGLDPAINVAAELVQVKSFDGQMVSGFLYRPDPKKFRGKRPLLIDIHGGPEGQTRPSFRGAANYYLNELGIALFYPNVRGSTGYGKRFVSLDNGPFKREDSLKDIGAYLTALKKDRGIDAAKIGVQGGSYGGYMCYASAIRYGAELRGALCTVAISNFVTFLENTQSYRRDLRRVEYGDERDAQQKAKLIEISPITRVKELKIPLLVVTGANDPRVPKSEADQMVAAVRANGGAAWHLVAADEGHGYAKKENRDYSTLVGLTFWQNNLLSGKTK
ncbi:prolyl oligopeptidase family serine peptidase [Sphingomonas sp. SUN019]|uniref:S9 family peptidase n=1 Tax=Sphingomonas sp. SUN019 TaxID=2937788 RepID=UPI00216439E6|nr:prolyl oligopeptidase family serine peptidase [Sphingomonas sp. SUN019]UVO51315.1 prolyl oligopeptidase family serine peptidase [Sphingomonas sp. SUN019]